MDNGNEPATALTVPLSDVAKQQAAASGCPQEPTVYLGLTKREHFAGLAMQGLLANPEVMKYNTFEQVAAGIRGGKRISDVAMTHADALLAALSEVEDSP